MTRTALWSLSDLTRAGEFAERLIRLDWRIVASRETVELLSAQGLPVEGVADLTSMHEDYGFPPTLHPRIEHALTADNGRRIDLVYVVPYDLSIGNDVGGRTLLALAVKGQRTAVMCPTDMERVLDAMTAEGNIPETLRQELADKASYQIASHYLSLLNDRRRLDYLLGHADRELLHGENPYQSPATAFACEENDPLSLSAMRQVSGETPCFTNMADADSIVHTLSLAAEAFQTRGNTAQYLCVAAKHGNACGMGADAVSPSEAIVKALWGDPLAIWGGEMATNFPIDENLANSLFRSEKRLQRFGNAFWMLDLIMAPAFTPEAIAVLGKRKERKLFANEALASPRVAKPEFSYRMVRGGFLRQPPATYVLDLADCQVQGPAFSEEQRIAIILAWAAAFSSNHGGNEVALARGGSLLSVGGGPSTIAAARVAIARAVERGHNLHGSAFAADAFFPFSDAPEALACAGATAGIVPAGGKNAALVADTFQTHGVTVAYLPEPYRGFCRH